NSVFFFQAEDGIRDRNVTGVQTCALPISIDETAKYPVKDTDFMTDDEERNLQRLADLEEGLYRKRLISYGGLLKEIHKELNLDDAEDGDLIHTDDEEKADEDGFSI